MSRAEPTAGGWKADQLNVDAYVNGVPTWLGSAEEGDVPHREAKANARLFAASKDLLAACEAALKWATYWDTNEQAKRDADTIRAAIAKAKGEP